MARIKQHNGIKYVRVTPWYKWDKLYKMLDEYSIDLKMRPLRWLSWADGKCVWTTNGVLHIHPEFLFGPSGPTIDTENSMRGAGVHDALYAGLREGVFLNQFLYIVVGGELREISHKEYLRTECITGKPSNYGMSHDQLRKFADQWIWKIMQEDGMSLFRADRWYDGLRVGGASAAKRNGEKRQLKKVLGR